MIRIVPTVLSWLNPVNWGRIVSTVALHFQQHGAHLPRSGGDITEPFVQRNIEYLAVHLQPGSIVLDRAGLKVGGTNHSSGGGSGLPGVSGGGGSSGSSGSSMKSSKATTTVTVDQYGQILAVGPFPEIYGPEYGRVPVRIDVDDGCFLHFVDLASAGQDHFPRAVLQLTQNHWNVSRRQLLSEAAATHFDATSPWSQQGLAGPEQHDAVLPGGVCGPSSSSAAAAAAAASSNSPPSLHVTPGGTLDSLRPRPSLTQGGLTLHGTGQCGGTQAQRRRSSVSLSVGGGGGGGGDSRRSSVVTSRGPGHLQAPVNMMHGAVPTASSSAALVADHQLRLPGQEDSSCLDCAGVSNTSSSSSNCSPAVSGSCSGQPGSGTGSIVSGLGGSGVVGSPNRHRRRSSVRMAGTDPLDGALSLPVSVPLSVNHEHLVYQADGDTNGSTVVGLNAGVSLCSPELTDTGGTSGSGSPPSVSQPDNSAAASMFGRGPVRAPQPTADSISLPVAGFGSGGVSGVSLLSSSGVIEEQEQELGVSGEMGVTDATLPNNASFPAVPVAVAAAEMVRQLPVSGPASPALPVSGDISVPPALHLRPPSSSSSSDPFLQRAESPTPGEDASWGVVLVTRDANGGETVSTALTPPMMPSQPTPDSEAPEGVGGFDRGATQSSLPPPLTLSGPLAARAPVQASLNDGIPHAKSADTATPDLSRYRLPLASLAELGGTSGEEGGRVVSDFGFVISGNT